MEHARVRELLNDHAAGRLEAATRAEVDAHLGGCAACRRELEVETALSAALARGLPRHAAPPALKAALLQRLGAGPANGPDAPAAAKPAVVSPRRRVRLTALFSAAAVAAIVLMMLRLDPFGHGGDGWDLVNEAVTDHLRVVASAHPLEIESGGIHQVKPWFTGRVDFGPRVAFAGDADFPLLGGSVGYVHDRKAAVFQFRRRLHAVTLLVFPWAGLPWPERDPVTIGPLSVVEQTVRGFSVLMWRQGDLAYALVSDVSRPDLEALAPRIQPD